MANPQSAFGLNLLGAMVGGCLEYAALLTGYRNLLIVVAALYLVAFLLKPKEALVPARTAAVSVSSVASGRQASRTGA